MDYYRLYFIDRTLGRIERVEELMAPDDASAESLAAAKLDDQPLELWQGRRMVRRLEPAIPGGHAHHVWKSAQATQTGSSQPR